MINIDSIFQSIYDVVILVLSNVIKIMSLVPEAYLNIGLFILALIIVLLLNFKIKFFDVGLNVIWKIVTTIILFTLLKLLMIG